MLARIPANFMALITQAFVGRRGGGEELVTVSDLSVHKQGSPVGLKIERVSFTLNGKDAKDLKCSGKNVPFPEPGDGFRCGKSSYGFNFWKGKDGEEFYIMIYHDVGDSHADLRGGSDIPTVCDNSQGSGPADEIWTQKEPVTFKIQGPVGLEPGM